MKRALVNKIRITGAKTEGYRTFWVFIFMFCLTTISKAEDNGTQSSRWTHFL